MTVAAKKTTAKKAAAAPARKSTTSKPAATKSASAKPAPKPAAKKVAAAGPDNDEEASEKSLDEFTKQVFTLIKNGIFDYCFTDLLDAVEEREATMATLVKEQRAAKSAPKKTTKPDDKKVVPMPTRAKKPGFVPEVGGTYVILDGHPLAGAKVNFVGFHKDDETKSRVKMVTDAPGAPVGKGVIVPTNMLKKPVARGRRSVKK